MDGQLLSQRRQQRKLSFLYNVNTGILPSYIHAFFPPLVSEISYYPLRNNRNIAVPFNLVLYSNPVFKHALDYQYYQPLKHLVLKITLCVPTSPGDGAKVCISRARSLS